jgi:hypothetical protein
VAAIGWTLRPEAFVGAGEIQRFYLVLRRQRYDGNANGDNGMEMSPRDYGPARAEGEVTVRPHDVERRLRETFGLDASGVRRVGMFLLAHAVVDTHLIARAMFKEISRQSAGAGLPRSKIEAIADKVAKGAFGAHLERVRAGLPDDTADIAKRLNDARNALLHWERQRSSLPVYKGQIVTTESGFRACMDDVLRFIQAVPFPDAPTGEER